MSSRLRRISIPRTSPSPELIVIRPSRVRIIVVLPAPLGPSKPIAPSGIDTVRFRNAVTFWYVLITSRS